LILHTFSILIQRTSPNNYNKTKLTHPQLLVTIKPSPANTYKPYVHTLTKKRSHLFNPKEKVDKRSISVGPVEGSQHSYSTTASKTKEFSHQIYSQLATHKHFPLQLTHGARLCPVCTHHKKTVDYILLCDQIHITQLWNEQAQYL
jgi:hypothetical protein